MKLSFTGKHIDNSDAFTKRMSGDLQSLCDKYAISPIDVSANLYRVGHGAHHFRLDVNLHLAKEMYLRVHGESVDAYDSLRDLLKRLEQKLRKHKKRLDDHHRRRDQHLEPSIAPSYVLQGNNQEHAEEELAPAVIAEMTTEIPTLTVSDAVMRLDFAGDPTLIFHNSGHGGINVIYRRSDGNIGWIDPQLKK